MRTKFGKLRQFFFPLSLPQRICLKLLCSKATAAHCSAQIETFLSLFSHTRKKSRQKGGVAPTIDCKLYVMIFAAALVAIDG
jgi:hypothetical protein